MEENGPLTKQHILDDYYKASEQDPQTHVQGVIYIETDRRLQDPNGQEIDQWAAQPIKEIEFLRSIVEGQYGSRDSKTLLGLVPWAPVHQGQDVFEEWLALAEKTAGDATWQRIKGFRFLVQGITDKKEFEDLVFSDAFLAILRSFNAQGRQYCFDVGIDQHSGGVWQLEDFTKVLEKLYDGVAEDQRVTLIMSKSD